MFFVRPRRFGKSLFISMMQCYYDRREKENFEKYFGGLWLGAHPTANRNKYMVLMLDFSQAGAVKGKTLQECFDIYLETCLDSFMRHYPACYDAAVTSSVAGRGVLAKFMAVVKVAHEREIPL